MCSNQTRGRAPWLKRLRGQRLLRILQALRDLDHRVAGVLEFDVAGNVVFLVAQELQHLLDRGVSLAPRHVRAVILLAILQVEMRDAIVVFLDIRYRIEIRRGEMADVEVDRVILRGRENRGERIRR